jgi:excisionase family DNA binding protein
MPIMYQKSDTASTYVGTSFAAKMLNLSVGTVQKLVNEGNLTAYMTSGGHRRISYDSVVKYGQRNKIPLVAAGVNGQYDANAISICVLYGEKGITSQLAEIVKVGIYQVVSDPMRLIRATGDISHIFIDARIEWMNWEQMERSTSAVHYVVYNSGVLPSATRKHLEKFASLITADISLELLNGYRLGLNYKCTEQSPQTFPHMVRQ